MSVQPGQVLAGKFRVERVLGEGGMGIVVAARHIALGERVAIKLLHRNLGGTPHLTERFMREARAAARLRSDHVARVSDVGTLDSGDPYMVMEYLEGSDLQKIVRERGALAVETAVDFVLQACEALAEAHACGIVHRDLKPANLFVTSRPDGLPWVKVIDFGISKMTEAGDQVSLTLTQGMLGSLLYMSPEQLRCSREVDARADIWALGVTLYELLTAQCPFPGVAASEVAIKIVTEPPVPLRTYRPDVSPELEGVVHRCLAKEVDRRWRTIWDLAAALQPFASPSARASVEYVARVSRAAGHQLGASSPALGDSVSVSGASARPVGTRPEDDHLPTFTGWGSTRSRSARSASRKRRIAVALAILAVAVTGGGLAAYRYIRGSGGAGDRAGVGSVSSKGIEPRPGEGSSHGIAGGSDHPLTADSAAGSAGIVGVAAVPGASAGATAGSTSAKGIAGAAPAPSIADVGSRGSGLGPPIVRPARSTPKITLPSAPKGSSAATSPSAAPPPTASPVDTPSKKEHAPAAPSSDPMDRRT